MWSDLLAACWMCLCSGAPPLAQAAAAVLHISAVSQQVAEGPRLLLLPAGELKQYLDELEGDEGRVLERWFYTDWLRSRQQRREQAEALREWRQRTAAGSSSCAAPPAQQAAAAAAGTPLASEADAATTRTAVAVATIERPAEEAALSAAPSEPAAEEAVPASEDPSKMPSFWSLDNPIVVTFAVLGMVAALSALLSKVTQLAGL